MGGLTMFPLSWLRKKNKNKIEPKYMFLSIINGVGNGMNMYKVKKMHGMSMWSNNVSEEYPSSF